MVGLLLLRNLQLFGDQGGGGTCLQVEESDNTAVAGVSGDNAMENGTW